MALNTHLDELYHLPAHDFPEPGATEELPAADAVAWRISASEETEEDWPETFARFGATVDLTRVRALIVGQWEDAYDSGPGDVIEALLAARDRLPALRALFLGDMVFTECEISWIQQTDVTALLTAFPELEEFGVRGGEGLGWEVPRHERLRSLVVQTGGLPARVVRGIGACELPALERLELWLGTTWYGADSEVADLEPVLSGARLPRLRHLALRNSDMQDAVAAAVASAPVVTRLDVLDLSMGTLGDDGAAALLAGRPLTHLKKLDLHHHYIGEPLRDRLRDALVPAGVELDLDEGDAEEDREDDGTVHRFVSVGE
ncbi:STM4015 family protein [Streptomyces tagetis]|uniref:STM4015 family protein n=1 Tax=Streptomyces tagetis TaxID=2820809 RepID=A0A940XM18_9ACTN|nr:STM4015 family protein [Streptomyces sp. RG38]MBQ0827039.1 STM4015 family protein [Streptomyces sp. RG38]